MVTRLEWAFRDLPFFLVVAVVRVIAHAWCTSRRMSRAPAGCLSDFSRSGVMIFASTWPILGLRRLPLSARAVSRSSPALESCELRPGSFPWAGLMCAPLVSGRTSPTGCMRLPGSAALRCRTSSFSALCARPSAEMPRVARGVVWPFLARVCVSAGWCDLACGLSVRLVKASRGHLRHCWPPKMLWLLKLHMS